MKNRNRIIESLAIIVCISSVSFISQAGDINQPTHIPNKATNKINQIKLRGLLADQEFGGVVDERINSGGINSIGTGRIGRPGGLGGLGGIEQTGCNLNVGNSVGGRTLGDRDVIVTGDIINVCE